MATPSLFRFLEAKPLYYKEIDHIRVHQAYARLKEKIRHPETVHIVGTNGKGSTGRMIADLAYRGGVGSDTKSRFSVGHFSSPHIVKFNERFWLDGKDADDEILEEAHRKLFTVLGRESSDALSYFEYSTLLALLVFEKCDLIVFEAGLGGEYDATNVCDKVLSVITPIGIDHQTFLGERIEEIAATKIRSIQRKMLLAPQPYPEVVKVAGKIAKEKEAEFYLAGECPVPDVENPGICLSLPRKSLKQLNEAAQSNGWPGYLRENAEVAVQALDLLGIPYRIEELKGLKLFGRFYPLSDNVRIDVGHNPLAAKAIAGALDAPVVLVYNSLDDKDYESVLRILKPRIKRVALLPIASQRAATMEAIHRALEHVGIPYSDFDGKIDREEHYLVFGSFYVVEAFIKMTMANQIDLV